LPLTTPRNATHQVRKTATKADQNAAYTNREANELKRPVRDARGQQV